MVIKIHTPELPAELLKALERARLEYSTAKTVFHAVWLHGSMYAGVFGDGENGAYEWFVWDDGKLEHSNCGYGSTDVALRDVLVKMVD